jgi:hypothetical protein
MEKKIKGIKKAVGDYNRWDGQARIYHDRSTGDTWTRTYPAGNKSWNEYRDPDVIEVHSKNSRSREKISMKELKEHIEGSDRSGRGPPRTGRDRVRADSSVKDRMDAAKATKAEASAEKAKIKAKQRDVLTEIQRQNGATHGIGFWRRRGKA